MYSRHACWEYNNIIMEKLSRKIQLIKGISNYFSAGQVYTNKTMFKYMNLETALLCLEHGNIRFAEPDTWRDSFESRFYTADYQNIKHCPSSDTPKLYACCFTYKKVSEAAWSVYNADQKGLGARCVQFVIKVDAFRKELRNALNSKDCVYEGRIDYSLGDSIITHLHTTKSKYHDEIHKSFGLNLYLSLMLLKRCSFSHEEELRIFIKRDGDSIKSKSVYDVPIIWANVIDKIYLAEDFSAMEVKIFEDICKTKGINTNMISKQSIYGKTLDKQITFSK